jgi:hypothetical protein
LVYTLARFHLNTTSELVFSPRLGRAPGNL